jgi:hypothetical protein
MAAISKSNLFNSTICRLCASANSDGKKLFSPENESHNLLEQIRQLEILKVNIRFRQNFTRQFLRPRIASHFAFL